MASDYERARDFAVRYLGYAPRTRKQLRDKLAEKQFSDEAIADVMQLLTEKGYLDDITFAQNYISHKTRINNYGRRRIAVDLLRKGVGKEDIQAAYSAISERDGEEAEKENETAAARRALDKRLGRRDIDEVKKDPKELQRLMAYLVRRGFSYDVVKKALQSHEEEQ